MATAVETIDQPVSTQPEQAEEAAWEQWCVVEIFGHKRLAGRVTEEQRFGGTFLRIDIPREDGSTVTQFYGQAALFSVSPVSEDVARRVAAHHAPEVVHSWELRPPHPQLTDGGALYWDRSDDRPNAPDGDEDDDDGIGL